jgi:hypothetical protein
MEVVMDNQELQNSVAKIAETLITTQRNLVTISRSLWAVRMSIRKMHPEFEDLYLNHFAEPEQAFEKMRDNLLDYGRELADLARRLRGEPASANTGFPLTTSIDSTVPPLDPLEPPP